MRPNQAAREEDWVEKGGDDNFFFPCQRTCDLAQRLGGGVEREREREREREQMIKETERLAWTEASSGTIRGLWWYVSMWHIF